MNQTFRYYYDTDGNIQGVVDVTNPELVQVTDLDLPWIESTNKYSTVKYKVVNGEFVEKKPVTTRVVNWQDRRISKYDTVGNQLNLLYDDITAGYFGEAAKSSAWYEYITQVKLDIPKD